MTFYMVEDTHVKYHIERENITSLRLVRKKGMDESDEERCCNSCEEYGHAF